MKDDVLVVYEMLDGGIIPTGIIENIISINYEKFFRDIGNFSFEIPFTQEAFALILHQLGKTTNNKESSHIIQERLVELDEDIFGICQNIGVSGEVGAKTIKVKGQLITGLFEKIPLPPIMPVLSSSPDGIHYAPTVQTYLDNVYTTVRGSYSVNPFIWDGLIFAKNLIPGTEEEPDLWKSIAIPNGFEYSEGGNFASLLRAVCIRKNLGYDVFDNPYYDYKHEVRLVYPKDRSINAYDKTPEQGEIIIAADPVILSAKFDNLISSEFSINSENYRNVIVTSGKFEYTDKNQKQQTLIIPYMAVTYDEFGDDITKIPAQHLRASYEQVDADLSNAQDEARVKAIIKEAAKQKLYEKSLIKSFECKQMDNNSTFVFGRDYFLGDTITLWDEGLDLKIDMQVESVQVTKDTTGKQTNLTFGYSQPTLNRILRQKGVI